MMDIAAAFHQTAGAIDPALVHCLDFMNDLPFFQTYKARTWDALNIGADAKILDVACGVGFDAIEMAKRYPQAQICGVDISDAFLDIARNRAAGLSNLSFHAGDASRLPFPDGHFDGVRIDRSLQHIPSPLSVIREMARVTRPGGRIVLAEPDWGTYALYNGAVAGGVAIAETWRASFINPYIGRELAGLLVTAGATEIVAGASVLTLSRFSDADIVFDLRRVLANCVASNVFSAGDGAGWLSDAEAASKCGSFFACLTIVDCSATICAAP